MRLLSVDLQRDFAAPEGLAGRAFACTDFTREVIVPFCRDRGLRIAEIVSDYRLPRPNYQRDICVPGTPGYESLIPGDVKQAPVWVKCMNAPTWVRDGIGDENATPGKPFPAPRAFGQWAAQTLGRPEAVEIALIGLTVDCCVLCVAQELFMRGYTVRIVAEGTDAPSADERDKERLLACPILRNWASRETWYAIRSAIADAGGSSAQ